MKKITLTINLNMVLTVILLGVIISIFMVPQTKAFWGMGDTSFVHVMPDGAALEQILKQNQTVLVLNQMFGQGQEQSDQSTAFARQFAAWTGNKKLIEIANSNPFTTLQNGLNGWISDFSNSVAAKLLKLFNPPSGGEKVKNEGGYDKDNGDKAAKNVVMDQGSVLLPGNKEDNIRNELVYRKTSFESLGYDVRYNYYKQDLDTKTNQASYCENINYPKNSIPDFIINMQEKLTQVGSGISSSNSSEATMQAQMQYTNMLLIMNVQINLRTLQTMNDLLKISYYNTSLAHSERLEKLYNKIQNFNEGD